MKQEEGLHVHKDLSTSVTFSGLGDMESTIHRSPVGLIVRSPETQESGLGKEGEATCGCGHSRQIPPLRTPTTVYSEVT